MQLVLVTQYFDTLKSIGESDKTNTLFLSHTPSAVKEVSDQILESMLVAQQAKTEAGVGVSAFSPVFSRKAGEKGRELAADRCIDSDKGGWIS